jgi:hypothetical protein
MSTEELVAVESVESERRFVCFVKRRACDDFFPCITEGGVAVDTIRGFLDSEIIRCLKVEIKPALLLRIPYDHFLQDLRHDTLNSQMVRVFGWNYPAAVRLAESEGCVFGLTIHPDFQSIPFSYRRVCDEDGYALYFVEQILSLRGGEIGFEEYDPAKHVKGCQYGGVSAVVGLVS